MENVLTRDRAVSFKDHQFPGKSPITVVKIPKKLDGFNSRDLKKNFKKKITRFGKYIIDCSNLDFLDSSGLGAIITCLRKAEEAEGKMCLAGLGSQPAMIFELTRVESLFEFYKTVEEAAESFNI